MEEKIVKLDGKPEGGKCRLWFRCSNCGCAFEFDMQKNIQASSMSGHCPHCGAQSGKPGIGIFPLIKFNPQFDVVHGPRYV